MDPIRDLQHEQGQSSRQSSRQEAVISGWELRKYLALIRTPVFFVVLGEMVLLIALRVDAVIWLMHLALFVFLALRTRDLTFKRALMLGAVSGFFAGLGMAIFKLVFLRAFFYLFNLIAEPVLTAVLGAAFTAVVAQFFATRRKGIQGPSKKS